MAENGSLCDVITTRKAEQMPNQKTLLFSVSKDPCTHTYLSEVMRFGNKTTLSSSIHGDQGPLLNNIFALYVQIYNSQDTKCTELHNVYNRMFLKSSVTYLVNNYSVLPISDSQKDDLVAVGSLSGLRLAVVVPSQNATMRQKQTFNKGLLHFY